MAGFVLAGGKSSRMGQDKALLEFGGQTLVVLAAEKLREVCGSVHILSSRAELEVYGPQIADLHLECGPIGGIEAALGIASAAAPWSLFLPVDMPLVPVGFLAEWVRRVMLSETARVALFTVQGVPQPALCLLHRDLLPYVEAAIRRGEYRLLRVFELAGQELAASIGAEAGAVFLFSEVPGESTWFVNLNTPEEFAAAAAHPGD